ncbi:hypothetical protein Bca4012_036351 [Brassica carinata]
MLVCFGVKFRHSVGRQAPSASLDLKPSVFDPKDKIWRRFPREGTKYTPPHQSSEFKWKDYCPLVFRSLRKLFKVDPADYMLSICGDDALRELSSPGKSGSFFYLTNDDRYMIKTMKKSETKVLLRMLAAYYNHVRAFENSLVIRFFGLHCVKLNGPTQKKVRFVIMGESEEEAGHRLSRAEVDDLLADPSRWASIRLGTNMPARAERTMRKSDSEIELVGEPTGEFYDVVMIFGIIDILQDYDISKKLEHTV